MCLERSERIAHSRSFDLSQMSEGANERWANERIPSPGTPQRESETDDQKTVLGGAEGIKNPGKKLMKYLLALVRSWCKTCALLQYSILVCFCTTRAGISSLLQKLFLAMEEISLVLLIFPPYTKIFFLKNMKLKGIAGNSRYSKSPGLSLSTRKLCRMASWRGGGGGGGKKCHYTLRRRREGVGTTKRQRNGF